ncbi:MAG: hypothetical protein C0631_02860 [Sedimenticola sp.]|nr:MAG: hypothetical protein C0631_02860 [Sedimenticola sp.]
MGKDQIYFRYKDYRDNHSKTMQLHCVEFIRRFLMHVLPKGLMRIRHYGLLAHRCRKGSLKTMCKILARPEVVEDKQTTDGQPVRHTCPKSPQGSSDPSQDIESGVAFHPFGAWIKKNPSWMRYRIGSNPQAITGLMVSYGQRLENTLDSEGNMPP